MEVTFNVERSDKNDTSGNTSIHNESLNDSLTGFYNSKKREFLTYFIPDNNQESQILVSNANVVFRIYCLLNL